MTRTLNALHYLSLTFAAGTLSAGMAVADQVFLDDVIVDGSLCVGQNCENNEAFGDDTIRLKESNLRIRAVDISINPGFPTTDWQLTFNETTNGGLNKFAIDNIDLSVTPFTIEGGSNNNALYVDDGGRIGLGTAAPVVELHIVDGDTAALRIEQDGSNGFTPQTWDVAGNESNFFIRDATNGSKLPFRIGPNSPTSAIFIKSGEMIINEDSENYDTRIESDTNTAAFFVEGSNGNVGVGTNAPTAQMHVQGADGKAKLLVEETSATVGTRGLLELKNNGNVFFTLDNLAPGGIKWNLQNNTNDFRLTNAVGKGIELRLTQDGDMTISGSLVTGGSECGGGCDAVFTDSYDMPTIAEHSAKMFDLGYLPNVGPTIENEPINVSDKLGRMLNELEHAHIFIADLNRMVAAQSAEIESLKALILAD